VKKKIIVIVQARLTSRRFPRKVIQKIGRLSIMQIIFERLKQAKLVDEIVFAIPSNRKNNILNNHLKIMNANIFRGSENNVLSRYFHCAKKYEATDIIRVTGDCPLIDPKIVDKLIRIYLKKKIHYLINCYPPKNADGFDVEIFSFNTLKVAKNNAVSKHDTEHVTTYIKRSKKFVKKYILLVNNFSTHLSLDTKYDLIKLRRIFNYFKPNIFFGVDEVFKKNNYKKIFNKKK
tara:strand:+ start:793 stop:1491 length:699 start_codon:yes stop_codon:yes gene_type:complete